MTKRSAPLTWLWRSALVIGCSVSLLSASCSSDPPPDPLPGPKVPTPNFDPENGPRVSQGLAADQLLAGADTTLRALTLLDTRDSSSVNAGGALFSNGSSVTYAGEPAADMWAEASMRLGAIDTLDFRWLDDPEDPHIAAALELFGPEDPFLWSDEISVSDLVPGDILVTTGPAQISQLIRIATWSSVSHSMLYVGNGDIIQASGSAGINRQTVKHIQETNAKVGVVRIAGLSEADAAKIVERTERTLAWPYNFPGLGAFGAARVYCLGTSGYVSLDATMACLTSGPIHLPSLIMDNDELFCSQIVTRVFAEAGVPLFEKNAASPQDLVRIATDGIGLRSATIVGHLPVGK